jgi:hypothetical protein
MIRNMFFRNNIWSLLKLLGLFLIIDPIWSYSSHLCSFPPLLSVQAIKSIDHAKTQTFTITGVITRDDGSPAEGIAIYLFQRKDGKLEWIGLKFWDDREKKELGPAGNPRDRTDANGRFTIKADRAFFDECQKGEFCIGTFEGGPKILIATEPIQANIILNTRLFDADGVLDINKLFKTIVLQQ